MKLSRRCILGFLGCLLLGSWVLFFTTPPSIRESGWPVNVVRNWQQFGLFNLHGQMAYNIAGEGLPSHPVVYAGHRPGCLYPAWLAGWAFHSDDGLVFHLLLSLAVGYATWRLLLRGRTGALAALLVVFAPGYLYMVAQLDPLDVPVILAIPFLTGIRGLLGRERFSAGALVMLAILIGVYASLNWTSLLGFGIVTAYLFAAMPHRPWRLLLYLVLCGVAGGLVLAVSVLSKSAPAASEAGHANGLSALFNNYFFGAGGYSGNPMNWPRALVRITVMSAFYLLPLWLLFGVVAWRSRFRRPAGRLSPDATPSWCAGWRWLRPLWPFLAALVFVFGMRNYFAAHPRMAGPVLMCGMVFSMRLMIDGSREDAEDPLGSGGGLLAPAGLAFIYGLGILLLLRAADAEVDSLLTLVRANTTRTDRLCVSPASDPWLVTNAARVAELADRVVVVLPEPWRSMPPTPSARFLLSTRAAQPAGVLVAKSDARSSGTTESLRSIVDWGKSKLIQRRKGEEMAMPAVMYLYRLP